MRQYFYDNTTNALIAFDPETNSLDVLPSLLTAPISAPPPATVVKKAPKLKAGKKQYGCGKCGKPGHRRTTCPEGDALPADEVSGKPADMPRGVDGAEKTRKIKRLLSEHMPYPEIAQQCGTTTQVVSFIAKQMQGRGEL